MHMFLFNIGCIGCHNDVRNIPFENGGHDCSVFLCKCYENQASPHLGMQEKESVMHVRYE